MDTWQIILMSVLLALGGYITASLVLLRYPTLLHKKKRLPFQPKHISHRGGAGESLENTMAAFQHACQNQTEMLELDCHITADGVVVVSHDNCLQRTCGIDVKVSETDYDKLPLLKSTIPHAFYPGVSATGDDRRIPTLREVFTAFPSIPINIDIKIYDEELMQKVNDLIVEFKREDLCLWGSFQGRIADNLHKINPSISTYFSFRGVVKLLLLFYTGLLPFIPLRESALEVMMPLAYLKYIKENTGSFRHLATLKIVNRLLMRSSLFRHLERRGIQTYLWVLNDDWEYEHAFKLGATGVMTDFPTKLTNFLQTYSSTKTQV